MEGADGRSTVIWKILLKLGKSAWAVEGGRSDGPSIRPTLVCFLRPILWVYRIFYQLDHPVCLVVQLTFLKYPKQIHLTHAGFSSC